MAMAAEKRRNMGKEAQFLSIAVELAIRPLRF
jgi:hypothetical protein